LEILTAAWFCTATIEVTTRGTEILTRELPLLG
jgi:hypothetical protein